MIFPSLFISLNNQTVEVTGNQVTAIIIINIIIIIITPIFCGNLVFPFDFH